MSVSDEMESMSFREESQSQGEKGEGKEERVKERWCWPNPSPLSGWLEKRPSLAAKNDQQSE